MNSVVRYLSHTDVLINPHIPAGEWGLNETGTARVQALSDAQWAKGSVHIVSSGEQKAIETAAPFGLAYGLSPEIRPDMHENDRSSTGYLPPDEFEATADAFFAFPSQSVRGWETAIAAQTRIVRETELVLETSPQGDLLIVGHGAVGALLMCHLGEIPISRQYDQPATNGGNFFSFHRESRKLIHRWKPALAER